MGANFPAWLDEAAEAQKIPVPSDVQKISGEAKEKPRRNNRKKDEAMSNGYIVVSRTTGGWRAPPTLNAMTLDEARERCKEMCNRYPHQEFDILGVIAKSKRTSKVSLETVNQPVPEAKRVKEPEVSLEDALSNVMPLRSNG